MIKRSMIWWRSVASSEAAALPEQRSVLPTALIHQRAFQHDAVIDDGCDFIDYLGAAKLVFAIMAIPRSSVFQFFYFFHFN